MMPKVEHWVLYLRGDPGITPEPADGASMLQKVVPRHENYSQSRTTALQNVESTITELSGIFTQLATMIAHQGELAIRIDDNMDESLTHVEGAHSALLKHLKTISSNSWKAYCEDFRSSARRSDAKKEHEKIYHHKRNLRAGEVMCAKYIYMRANEVWYKSTVREAKVVDWRSTISED